MNKNIHFTECPMAFFQWCYDKTKFNDNFNDGPKILMVQIVWMFFFLDLSMKDDDIVTAKAQRRYIYIWLCVTLPWRQKLDMCTKQDKASSFLQPPVRVNPKLMHTNTESKQRPQYPCHGDHSFKNSDKLIKILELIYLFL